MVRNTAIRQLADDSVLLPVGGLAQSFVIF